MEYRILGPLEAADEAGGIELGGRKPRALLGRLLIDVNRVVAPDRLIDDLWDGAPPPSAMTTLQTYVSHLRKLGVVSLRTRATGYVLEAGPEAVDARRFEQIVAEVRRRREDPERAAADLAHALSLWRGPALVDFADTAWARLEAGRLESLRLDAVGDEFDARLALGQDRAQVPELEMLVESQPFYERFWGQLMLALYRSGRQADALRTYARLRSKLGDELGIAPSIVLARLEESILLQKPELDWQPLTERPPEFAADEAPRSARFEAADPEGSAVVALSGERLTIGRSRANDIALVNERAVSRVHALVERVASTWCLRDLGSRNGTVVNDERIVGARALRDGDTVTIGSWSAIFHEDRDSESGITAIT